jgi:hypothetical protein
MAHAFRLHMSSCPIAGKTLQLHRDSIGTYHVHLPDPDEVGTAGGQ